MGRIDVHMLLLGHEREDWMKAAIASVPPHVCNLHVLDGILGDLGAARTRGYAIGDASYVSHVDPDDWIETNTFERCLDYLDRHPRCPGAVTHEMVHDQLRNRIYETRDKHGLAVYRREWLRANLYRLQRPGGIDVSLSKRPEIVLLPFVGRHWRRHERASFRLRSEQGAARHGLL